MTGLVNNCDIGSGIFGMTGHLIVLPGAASPLAMIVAAITVIDIDPCGPE
jgi:hypothetical protein